MLCPWDFVLPLMMKCGSQKKSLDSPWIVNERKLLDQSGR
jgi:hypothetical protein